MCRRYRPDHHLSSPHDLAGSGVRDKDVEIEDLVGALLHETVDGKIGPEALGDGGGAALAFEEGSLFGDLGGLGRHVHDLHRIAGGERLAELVRDQGEASSFVGTRLAAADHTRIVEFDPEDRRLVGGGEGRFHQYRTRQNREHGGPRHRVSEAGEWQ